jgi:hypothetical protein
MVEMSKQDAAERLRARVAQYYGVAISRALFPPGADVKGEAGGSQVTSGAAAPLISEGEASAVPGEAERLVMAALLVLLHEEGGGYKVTFMLPDLLGLLGWPVAESSWRAVERALDFYMQPVRSEYCVSPPTGVRGREISITSLRRLIAGHEYYEESERGDPESIRLAGRQVAVTFNPDVPLGTAGPERRCLSEADSSFRAHP